MALVLGVLDGHGSREQYLPRHFQHAKKKKSVSVARPTIHTITKTIHTSCLLLMNFFSFEPPVQVYQSFTSFTHRLFVDLGNSKTSTMSLARLPENEKRQALQRYDEIQERQLNSTTAVDDFVDKAKSSLLFQYNWEELLSAAPLSINLIGSCYIACSLERATEITLELPLSGSFEHLS